MCTSAVWHGRVIWSVGELRRALGAIELVQHPDYDTPLSHDDCLCPIDIEATAAKAGLTARHASDGDPMQYILEGTP